MTSTFHRDCDIQHTFSVSYDTEQCDTLVAGYSRTECKRFVVPAQITQMIASFVESVIFDLETNAESLSHCFEEGLCQDCWEGNWYVSAGGRSAVPFRILSIRRFGGGKGCSRKSCLAIESPFASNASFKNTPLMVSHMNKMWKVKTMRHRYLVSHLDDDELVCLDDNFEEMYWRISERKSMKSKMMQQLVHKVKSKIQESEARGKDLYAIVLESYCRDPCCILRTVVDVQIQSDREDLTGNKCQRQRPTLPHSI